MNITISKLILTNFKGIKSLEVNFNSTTNIYGENGTGKSTLFDAFTWLLFGKDSHDSKDFNIKTLDETGQAIAMVDHAVEGTITQDGTEITLKRLYLEKWTRRRGSEQSELTGHETLFYYNGVPLQENEYKTKIDALVNEGLFKLLTSTLFFNNMKWQDKRQVLIQIAGTIGKSEVVAAMDKSQVTDLNEILNASKDMAEFKKEVSVRKKKLSDDLKLIPSRIDEVQRSIPQGINADEIQKSIIECESTIAEIDGAITDQVNAYKEQTEIVQKKQTEIFELKKKIQSIEFEITNEWRTSENERKQKHSEIQQAIQNNKRLLENERQTLANDKSYKKSLEDKLFTLRNDWSELSGKELEFKPGEFICPSCKRELNPDTIAEQKGKLVENFEKEKNRRLSDIARDGETISKSITQLENKIKESELRIAELENTPTPTEEIYQPLPLPSTENNTQIIELRRQISEMELQVLSVPRLDVDGLKQQKSQTQSRLDELRRSLTVQSVIDRGNARIKELMAEEKSLAQQISDLEKKEFAMESFDKIHMDMVEQRVNSRFKLVTFRMFSKLINGGTEPCCDCMLNGVPYSDVNSAGKIQAGIDIINTLSSHYGVFCPIWIDNRESTNDIPETLSQIINLIVSKDKSLTIN